MERIRVDRKLLIEGIFLIVAFVLVRTDVFAQEPDSSRIISIRPPFERAVTGSNESQLAIQYYRNQEWEKAMLLYEKLYKESPTYVNYNYYFYCLIQTRNYQEAERLTKKQIRTYPDKLRYRVDLGYIYQMSDEPARAKKEFDDALDRLPPDRNAIVELAGAFQSRREINYAVQTYMRGRQLLGFRDPFHMEIGMIYELEGKYEQMFDEYLSMIDFDPGELGHVQARIQSTLVDDPEGLKSEILRISLLKRIQQNPDRIFYSEMLIWFSIQQKDFQTALLQAKALDRRFNEQGERVFEIGQLCASNEEYDAAIDAFSYIINKGGSGVLYLSGRVELLNAMFLKYTSAFETDRAWLADLEHQYLELLREFGYNNMTLSLMRNLAHLQAFYLDKQNKAIELLDIALQINTIPPPIRAECKLELADILLFSGDPWEATLLYSQVEKEFKHEPLGHEAKFRNARLSFYIGEFQWAKAQLDVLKAATSKLIANDAMEMALLISDNMDYDSTFTALAIYAEADLMLYQHKEDQALALLDSLQYLYTYHPISDEILYKKAQIALRKGQFTKADTLLEQLVATYPFDILADNALMMRARLQEEQFRNPETAMELYQSLLRDYPGSLFVVEARKRFRELRGDVVN